MSTTLFEAPPYDPRRERRRNTILITAIVAVLVIGALGYLFRNLPYERLVDHFFDALEQKDFEKAYGIWLNDPNWKQDPGRHPNYSFHDFYVDWGPGGEWGIIRQHKIVGSAAPTGGSGVVVVVKINERAEDARIWVERKDKTLTFSPY
jgi:hypothetical protein